jgi:hypothetical protein
MKSAAFVSQLPGWQGHVNLGPPALERRQSGKHITDDANQTASNAPASRIPVSLSISRAQLPGYRAVRWCDTAAEKLGFILLSTAATSGLLLHLLAGSQWIAKLPAFESMIGRVLGG